MPPSMWASDVLRPLNAKRMPKRMSGLAFNMDSPGSRNWTMSSAPQLPGPGRAVRPSAAAERLSPREAKMAPGPIDSALPSTDLWLPTPSPHGHGRAKGAGLAIRSAPRAHRKIPSAIEQPRTIQSAMIEAAGPSQDLLPAHHAPSVVDPLLNHQFSHQQFGRTATPPADHAMRPGSVTSTNRAPRFFNIGLGGRRPQSEAVKANDPRDDSIPMLVAKTPSVNRDVQFVQWKRKPVPTRVRDLNYAEPETPEHDVELVAAERAEAIGHYHPVQPTVQISLKAKKAMLSPRQPGEREEVEAVDNVQLDGWLAERLVELATQEDEAKDGTSSSTQNRVSSGRRHSRELEEIYARAQKARALAKQEERREEARREAARREEFRREEARREEARREEARHEAEEARREEARREEARREEARREAEEARREKARREEERREESAASSGHAVPPTPTNAAPPDSLPPASPPPPALRAVQTDDDSTVSSILGILGRRSMP